nr:rhodanese-like domain-containing protein [Jezberella montanilacus]
MTQENQTYNNAETLDAARAVSQAAGLPYAGNIPPKLAWNLFSAGFAELIDVRSAEERKFVGYVPNSIHVAWATGTSLNRNPRFTKELELKTGKSKILLLLCRSGKRSALAAEAATKAGFTSVFNVLDGFEGNLDAQQHRGAQDGWRFNELPWIQD